MNENIWTPKIGDKVQLLQKYLIGDFKTASTIINYARKHGNCFTVEKINHDSIKVKEIDWSYVISSFEPYKPAE